MTKTNGDAFTGHWKEDKFSGFGKVCSSSYILTSPPSLLLSQASYPNGGTYYGYWIDSKRHGVGVFEWPDGAKFAREYTEDRLVSGSISFSSASDHSSSQLSRARAHSDADLRHRSHSEARAAALSDPDVGGDC